MSNIYTISDTHFNHKNIIDYCNRPFKSVTEMDNTIIQNWNNTVTNEDIIIHCGDFVLGTSDEIRSYAKQLNGKKILILGNHDRKGKGFFESCGFQVIKGIYSLAIEKDGVIQKYAFSHAPIEHFLPDDVINIFGHIHNYPLNDRFNKANHKCVSVECIDYTPMKLT
ncbi:metallophosphoesterase [Clostridium sp.]|uniref:metallophosphoesterase n=1 Tax=Clostridium sp. TaxID=1506 RepID=UPI002609BA5A|nr:metallophosphoesterase [Clostridium sp.]